MYMQTKEQAYSSSSYLKMCIYTRSVHNSR